MPGRRGTWWTDPMTVLPERAAQFPDGYVDLGAAHGQAGVVALLAVAAALGIDGADCGTRCGAIPCRGGTRLTASPVSVAWSCPAAPPAGRVSGTALTGRRRRRVALCVAAACWPTTNWQPKRASPPARRGAAGTTPPARSTPVSRHGVFGIAHLLRRLGHDLGDDEVRERGARRFEEGLAMRRDPSEGIAGFVARTPSAAGTMHDTASTGLLEGAGGMALASLARRLMRLVAVGPFLAAATPRRMTESTDEFRVSGGCVVRAPVLSLSVIVSTE